MTPKPIDIAFTPAIKAAQEARGSRRHYADRDMRATITPDLAAFIASRRSAYLATASADGQPYVQHRGGPAGFLKVLDETTIGFADFAGNRQYVSLGNLSENPRAFLFLMDYATRQRIKMWGTASVVEGDENLIEKLMPPGYRARPERVIVFSVTAWDPNCPQHIPQLYDEDTVRQVTQKMTERIATLEAEVARLRNGAS